MRKSSAQTKRYNRINLFLAICIGLLLILSTAPTPVSQAIPVLSVAGSGTDTYPGSQATYRLELLNHTDQIVYDGVLSATLPPGFSYVPNSTVALGEGWPMENREPTINGQTLTWGPYHLPAAGIQVHNPFGIHTLMDSCDGIPALHLEGAKILAGNGGYVTQLFYPIDTTTTGPTQCAINFVQEAYARNLIPIIRLQGYRVNGVWQAPNPGASSTYAEIAQAYANFVAGLPRRDTNPLYIAVWNEPDLWIEWSGQPNATQYGRFFVAVSSAIRQIGDARIRVINGALTPGNPAFLQQMLNVPGFRDAFDVWASHCYPYNHPAWYNIHSGSAQYGTYAIDCYLEETAIINSYGRSNVKVILTETGYALGTNTFGFEGFAPINESNRADHIVSAFRDYWQNWPEVVAVTPFELTDPSGHWATFDWVYPTYPYPGHAQYDAVAALPKPAGELQPYGYQIIFKAKVDSTVPLGSYSLHLSGSDRDGNLATNPNAATITISAPVAQESIYLPVIIKAPGNDGPWYLTAPQTTTNTAGPGAIVPTDFLTATQGIAAAAIKNPLTDIPLPSPPLSLALDEAAGLGAVLLSNGQLAIIDLATHQSTDPISVGDDPQAITAGSPGSSQFYVSLADGLVSIDAQHRHIIARQQGLGRLRGLAWDERSQRLLAVDADQNRLLAFNADLSGPVMSSSLDHQPDQLLLDELNRQLYISFPAASLVITVDTGTLIENSRATVVGGPIFEMALDSANKRLYVLHALSPTRRGITMLETSSLSQLALVAGSEPFAFQTAATLALLSNGDLLVPEYPSLWQIDSRSFAVTQVEVPNLPIFTPQLQVNKTNGLLYLLDTESTLLQVYQ